MSEQNRRNPGSTCQIISDIKRISSEKRNAIEQVSRVSVLRPSFCFIIKIMITYQQSDHVRLSLPGQCGATPDAGCRNCGPRSRYRSSWSAVYDWAKNDWAKYTLCTVLQSKSKSLIVGMNYNKEYMGRHEYHECIMRIQ